MVYFSFNSSWSYGISFVQLLLDFIQSSKICSNIARFLKPISLKYVSVKTHVEEIILGFMLYKTLKPQSFIHGEVKRTYFYNPLFNRFALMPFKKNSINHRTNMLIIGISKNTQWEIILGSLLHKNPRP
jgi:hypothetical protein